MNPDPIPNGFALTPFDPEFQRDPYPVLRRLQEAAPAQWDELMHGWLVTTHDEVREILRDKEFWSDPRKAEEAATIRRFILAGDQPPSMLFLDDPDHRRLRGLINKAFTPKAVETMRPRIAAIASDLLAAITEPEFDLMERFAAPLPVIVIAEMLGIDPRQQADFKAWSNALVSASFNLMPSAEEAEAALRAQEQLDACFRGAIARRRATPMPDLISAMIAASDGGDSMTDDEIVMQCNLLLIAGNVTTTDLIGNGVKALLEHPNELAKLRQRPELIENAVEEMLRFDSPVMQSGRIANRPVEIHGCPIHPTQSVGVSLAAANRDPNVYPDPDRFDVERADTHHQSFGGGRHFCLGAPLARAEAQEAVRALLVRFSSLEAAPRDAAYRTIPGFRGLAQYWIRTRRGC